MTGLTPLVSICIPAYDGARWIGEALASALAQDHPSIEVVVVDDASTDGTADIASSTGDPRVRVLRSDRRIGMAANWNRAVRASRGAYVGLLMQDDVLEPDAASAMAAILDRDPGVGLVFAARRIRFEEGHAAVPADVRTRLGSINEGLEPLGEINEGARLVAVMCRERFRVNRVGEPSAVLIRRSLLAESGLFNLRLVQQTDLELWLRLAARGRVGYVRRPLATFRVHGAAASARNRLTGGDWLDRAWLVEGLRADPATAAVVERRTLFVIRAAAVRDGLRLAARPGGPGSRRLLRDAGAYVAYLTARRRPPLHEPLGDPVGVGPDAS